MLQKNVDWQFNPPAGSHHGGVWERIIRIIRKAMNNVLKEQTLDDEGLNTLMCEIEYMNNDRPITKNTYHHSDLEPLTPNHLLLMKRKPNLPPGVLIRTTSITGDGGDKFNIWQICFGVDGYGNTYRYYKKDKSGMKSNGICKLVMLCE